MPQGSPVAGGFPYTDLGTGPFDPRTRLASLRSCGQRCDVYAFYGHRPHGTGPGPWVLSQWFDRPFTHNGVTYRDAETFMMAAKARLFGDDGTRNRILAATGPAQAKALGRAVAGFDETVWAAHAYRVVVAGNLAKFRAHPDLWTFLDGTGDRLLVEAAPRDRIWGVGLPLGHTGLNDPRVWRGTNLLGFALTETRDRLRTQA